MNCSSSTVGDSECVFKIYWWNSSQWNRVFNLRIWIQIFLHKKECCFVVGCYDSGTNSVFYPQKYIPTATSPDLLHVGYVESESQCIEKCAEETFDACHTTQFINNTRDNTTGKLSNCTGPLFHGKLWFTIFVVWIFWYCFIPFHE